MSNASGRSSNTYMNEFVLIEQYLIGCYKHFGAISLICLCCCSAARVVRRRRAQQPAAAELPRGARREHPRVARRHHRAPRRVLLQGRRLQRAPRARQREGEPALHLRLICRSSIVVPSSQHLFTSASSAVHPLSLLYRNIHSLVPHLPFIHCRSFIDNIRSPLPHPVN